MAVRIMREGVSQDIPEEAYICPTCSRRASSFEAKELIMTPHEQLQQCVVPLYRKLVPTFVCANCKCIWQWDDVNVSDSACESQEDVGQMDKGANAAPCA